MSAYRKIEVRHYRFSIILTVGILSASHNAFAMTCGAAMGWAAFAPPVSARTSTYHDFLGKIAAVVGKSHVNWSTPLLKAKKVRTAKRAREIVDMAFNDAQFSSEFDAFLEQLGGIQSPKLWDEYFKAYDSTVGYCDGYGQLIDSASRVLPAQGIIRDYGAGTGNFSAGIISAVPTRTVEVMDISPVGLKVAEEKAAAAAPESKFSAKITNLKEHAQQSGDGKAAGAVMNNVLYTFKSREEKKALIRRVFEDLQSGGIFVLNDPIPQAQTSHANLQGFITDIGVSAAKNESPMNEFDLSLVAAINKKVLAGGSSPFMTPRELRELAQEVGFVVQQEGSGYYNRVTTLVLRKP